MKPESKPSSRLRALLPGLAALALSAAPAHAASFDCARAETPDEIAICKSPVLSELDAEMAALWFSYSSFPLLMGANAARRDEAKAFPERRAACSADPRCLQSLYRTRIATLKDGIKGAIRDMQRQIESAGRR